MHRRSIPLAAGVVALLAFAPVLGGQSTLWAAEGSDKATTTTAAADDSAPPDDSMPRDDSGSDSGSDAGSGTGSGKSSSTTATTRKGNATPTTASTAPGSGPGTGSSANCAPPETDRAPAPQVGDAPSNHQASEAGEVEVERKSDTELRIVQASPNDGWTHTVTAPEGPRVNVRFSRSGQSPSIVRFAVSMDQAGQELHIRITECG